jgi:diguanylate cyclase (GGDEF)-like protein
VRRHRAYQLKQRAKVVMQLKLHDLAQIDVFQNVDLAPLEHDLRDVLKLELPANHTLLSPQQQNENIYALLDGALSVRLQPDEQEINRIHPGACVGEISIIDDKPPSAWVHTASACSVLAIHRSVLTAMFEKQPKLAVNLLKLLGERFRHSNLALTHSMKMQEEYRRKAERDALTGLHNRVWMDEVFPRQLELSARVGQHICMMMIDADHFKQVNDLHGHSAGDDALRHLAKLIDERLRETDLVLRYGGEEFIALLPGTDSERALRLAEAIRQTVIDNPLKLTGGLELKLSVSIGVSPWRNDEHLHKLIDRADRALYQSKGNGRNQVTFAQ